MGKIVWYEHYGHTVAVDEELKGKHKEHCLCYRCKKFNPGEAENCIRAHMLYSIDLVNNMVTPVWECPLFVKK